MTVSRWIEGRLPQTARFLHADLDAFYASVAQRDNPDLQHKPVIVGGGVVLAASYEARRFGVRTAMGGRQALALCPRAIVVEPDMTAYSEASAAVFEIFRDTTPFVEPLSIDEAFLEVTGLANLKGSDVEIGLRLRQRVRAEVGLPISVGGGSTKFLSKVASAHCKPDGLLVVPGGQELEFLHPLPVGKLWGVGPVTAERLAAKGLRTVGEVAEVDPGFLRRYLGRAAGTHVAALSVNDDRREIETNRRRRSVGSQRSFGVGTVGWAEANRILVDVVDRVCRRLRTGDRVARTVVLRLRYGDFQGATRSRTLTESTSNTSLVLAQAKGLLKTAWPEIEDRGLTKIGIAVSGLGPADAVQLGLPFNKDDGRRLDTAVDDIRERFGNGALIRATTKGVESREMPLLPD